MLRYATMLLMILGLCASCGVTNGVEEDEDIQSLDVEITGAPGGTTVLHLQGPDDAGSSPVSYFVFGSAINLGDRRSVPLSNFRQGERLITTLAVGETLSDVDLSDWNGYDFVYLRAVPPVPQIIVELKPGNTYTFSTN